MRRRPVVTEQALDPQPAVLIQPVGDKLRIVLMWGPRRALIEVPRSLTQDVLWRIEPDDSMANPS